MDGPFAALSRFAAAHHGLFRIGDARDRKVSEDRLQTLVDQGWCRRVSVGVYQISGAPATGRQAILAEVWSHRCYAVASHRAAAHLRQLLGYRVAQPEVSLRHGSNQRGRARVHVSLWLPDPHVNSVDHIPTTTVPRTIFDLAGIEPMGRIEAVLDDALSRKLCTLEQMTNVMFALGRRGRRGTATMGLLLDDRGEGYVPPASELERRARRIFRDAGVPMPEFEVDLGDDDWIGRVDCVWRAERLIVELDGQRYHGSRSARERDRIRDNRLIAAGWRVIRITWDDLQRRPDDIVRQIRRALLAGAAPNPNFL